jgi:hypothetical protein
MNIFGINIVESPLCLIDVPKRKHKKCGSQSESYHARVQKKWVKRFGTTKERVAIFFNPSAVGMPGSPRIALDPSAIVMLRSIGA